MARCRQPVKATGKKSMNCPTCGNARAHQSITRCNAGHIGCDKCVGPVGSPCKVTRNP